MRAAVQDAYTAAAQGAHSCCEPQDAHQVVSQADGCCCSNEKSIPAQDVAFMTDYSAEERAHVPAEAEEISLGC